MPPNPSDLSIVSVPDSTFLENLVENRRDYSGAGQTVRELAKVLRVSPDRIRAWIKSGELGAINMADSRCGKPRFVVLPHHVAEFERSHRVIPPQEPHRRRCRSVREIDFYPD